MSVLAVAGSMVSEQVWADSMPVSDGPSGDGTARLEWQFDSEANPALPEVSADAPLGAKASIAPGEFSLAWQRQLAGLGEKIGYWDLGRSGKITLDLGAPQPSLTVKHISVQVCQWFDGMVYGDFASVSIPRATQVALDAHEVDGGAVGGWVVDDSLWEVAPGTTVDTIVITGASDGSVIDQVVIETVSVVPEPTVLSIQRLAPDSSLVEISWPVAAGSATIESSTDLSDPQAWATVDAQPQVNGDRYTVRIEASDTMHFFRLKQ